MDKNSKEQEEEINDIYSALDKIASSGIEFRRTMERCVFNRLVRLFQAKGKKISRDTKLSELFEKRFLTHKWKELNEINFRIPELKRSKLFHYLSIGYLAIGFLSAIIFASKNLELVFVVWGQPLFAIMWPILFSPVLVFMLIFQKRHLPAETIDQLVDQIVSETWTNLIADNKAMFHKVIREEMEQEGRGTAYQNF